MWLCLAWQVGTASLVQDVQEEPTILLSDSAFTCGGSNTLSQGHCKSLFKKCFLIGRCPPCVGYGSTLDNGGEFIDRCEHGRRGSHACNFMKLCVC